MDYICIGLNCWGRGPTPEAALAAAVREGGRNAVKEHLTWECGGEADQYEVSPIDGSLVWETRAPQPVRVARRYADGRINRTRKSVDELRAEMTTAASL